MPRPEPALADRHLEVGLSGCRGHSRHERATARSAQGMCHNAAARPVIPLVTDLLSGQIGTTSITYTAR